MPLLICPAGQRLDLIPGDADSASGKIFFLFFKKNAEQSENNVEFLNFRKYNTLQSCKEADHLTHEFEQ